MEKQKAARKAGEKFTQRRPREPLHAGHVKRPAGHYNAMVAPLQPYAIRGVIWYQGEANSRPPFCTQYEALMNALVDDWRTDWASAAKSKRENFPFYLVQLPNYGRGHAQGWPIIREQMFSFGKHGDNTGSVTTIDVGDKNDIHPKDKLPVGERLAMLARAEVYGEEIVASGPTYWSMRAREGKAVITFQNRGDGLRSNDDKPLRHFEIAGDDKVFHSADATIVGNTVHVSSPKVSEPEAVRYAWSNNPEDPNFFNSAGLPACPFRTDRWKIKLD